MSHENVETVLRVYAEWERGNLQAGVDLFDPKIAFDSFMPDADERVLATGPDQIEAFMREFLAQWRDYRLYADDIRELGSDGVFVVGHQNCDRAAERSHGGGHPLLDLDVAPRQGDPTALRPRLA